MGVCADVLNISFLDATNLCECFKYKFSQCDGRRGTFSFYRKICKLAPILISGWFSKSFTFMLLALYDVTTAQLQICSSERNVPLLPVGWRKYSWEIYFRKSCLWNKYTATFSKKCHRGIYANKIHVKDTIVVPTRWKFNIQIPEGLYRSKIAFPDTAFSKKPVSGKAIFTI